MTATNEKADVVRFADGREIRVGRHYRRTAYPYDEVRRVFAIEDGKIGYVRPNKPDLQYVKARTFADWAGYEVPFDEVPHRYSRLLTIGSTSIWSVMGRQFLLDYWYAFHPHALYGDAPVMTRFDADHQFDVRTLPGQFLSGLDIEIQTLRERPIHLSAAASVEGERYLSPLECQRRMRAAHLVAIARAIDADFDLIRHSANERERSRRDAADMTAKLVEECDGE